MKVQGLTMIVGGGTGWQGDTTCVSGYKCTVSNEYYSQCLPSSGGAATTTDAGATTTTTASNPTGTGSDSGSGGVPYAGVNIAGFDFGCTTDGTCVVSSAYPPGSKGIAQMNHFVDDDGLNVFRLPVGWQYLLNGNLGGNLDSTNFANYDSLVQGCLSSGAELCIIDIHNYARWNGGIIGQGGPTNSQYASLCTS
jgi:endoglucanase